jgi:Curli production assembly/transport component CsgG
MKTRNALISVTLLAAFLLPAWKMLAADDVLTVAVFDFDSPDEGVRGLGPKAALLVNAALSADPQIITVERTDLEKVLGEQGMGLSGTVSPDTAAKVGQLTGAKVLVTGRVFKADDQTILVAKVIGTETSRVYGEMVQGGPASPITDLSAALEKKIAADITGKAATLVAKVESRDDRIAKIKQSLAGKTLPVVSVKISEQHYGPHIIDPAAQTELSVILQQCGFTLVDENSTNHAAIQITGEAFSAFGMQKGNLISCKSRIELKARDVATGKILTVDRQTSVGVDIAEQTAAKSALENAADLLAGRVVPALVQ